jgi:hypothetical protein
MQRKMYRIQFMVEKNAGGMMMRVMTVTMMAMERTIGWKSLSMTLHLTQNIALPRIKLRMEDFHSKAQITMVSVNPVRRWPLGLACSRMRRVVEGLRS